VLHLARVGVGVSTKTAGLGPGFVGGVDSGGIEGCSIGSIPSISLTHLPIL
jgi:hypothetical protein